MEIDNPMYFQVAKITEQRYQFDFVFVGELCTSASCASSRTMTPKCRTFAGCTLSTSKSPGTGARLI
jgi:hypothetical protein